MRRDRVHACVSDGVGQAPPTGTIRITADPTGFGDPNQGCSPGEHPLDWNQEGPEGEKGKDGDRGPEGAAGPRASLPPGLTDPSPGGSAATVNKPTTREIGALVSVIAKGGPIAKIDQAVRDVFDVPDRPPSVRVVASPRYFYATEWPPAAPDGSRTFVAHCPAGEVALGGGYDPYGHPLHRIEASKPVGSPPTAWSATVAGFRKPSSGLFEPEPLGEDFDAPVGVAYAICARGVKGATVVSALESIDTAPRRRVTAQCPSSTHYVTGGGHEITERRPVAVGDDGYINVVGRVPRAGPAFTPDGWYAEVLTTRPRGDAELRTYAVCARLATPTVRIPSKDFRRGDVKEDGKEIRTPGECGSSGSTAPDALAPKNRMMVGGGHEITGDSAKGIIHSAIPDHRLNAPQPPGYGGFGRPVVLESFPSYIITARGPTVNPLESDFVNGSFRDVPDESWGVRAWGVCATP